MKNPKDLQSSNFRAEEEWTAQLKTLYAPDARDKEAVRRRIRNRARRRTTPAIAAAAALLVFTLPFTGFGESIVETIRQVATPTNRIVVHEEKANAHLSKRTLPETLKGKLYDRDGREITDATVLDKMEPLFTREGKEIEHIEFDDATGQATFVLEEETDDIDFSVYEPIPSVADRLTFTPLVLSERYPYEYADVYATDDTKTDYVAFHYKTKDGKEIYIDQRRDIPGAGYEIGGEEPIETRIIDGIRVIVQGSSLYAERDGILLGVTAKDADKGELLAIYRDLRPLE